jgi:acyl-coenzyme A thioesterase PaaI-like protein
MQHATKLRWWINLWPPNLAAGIRVLRLDADYRHARVRLGRYWFNRNYVGTHFGGSLFAMTDPWWMIMMLRNLGPDYIVWDKSAAIDFVKAVREPVYAEFVLDAATVDAVRAVADREGKALHWFQVDVKTADGTLVARVRKQVHVRRKRLGSEAITEREAPAGQ